MKYTRIYTGADQEAHFEDVDVPLHDQGDIGFLSTTFKATGVIFRETPGTYHYQWHNAPKRQFVVVLEGKVEVEVGSGEKRLFQTGDVFLAEDTTGRGHISRAIDGKPRKSLFITLE
eukprot:comp33190_c0_seq1/m.47275 comp33190_c0_seq1/g.47275  ORF comp33190_c0_seq1/g.47275 comp33190_c0_seq1/m.47275 type:complete len:117 (-) comp33190_c0_seq1:116-466(-)